MPTPQITKEYLLGLLHDGTERKTTFRISTNNFEFAKIIKDGIGNLGRKAWIYKEGKNRNLWIIEFSKTLLNNVKIVTFTDKINYLKGYFDAEGGIAKSKNVRYYIYFCQKNQNELNTIKEFLKDFSIECGKIHNPSKRKDPDYWRFFVRANSYIKFAEIIGSFHPDKKKFLRMKI